jgi:GT2 family glycosyltransferase
MPVPAVLARVPAIAQETCFWRRRVTERIGLFDESLHFALDYDYWLRALKAGFRFHLLNRFLGGFRIHGGSKSSNLTALRDAELAQLYARHLNRQITHEQMRAEVRAVRDARWPFLSAATAEKLREAPLLWLMLATRRRLPAAHPPLM